MATYRETIQTQMARMPKAISWWPNYLYHFTDVNHAVSIIDKGWIYGRAIAEQAHLTKTDAASHNVLNVTGETVKHCGRLYMRPLTPTQFYNEGYKPEGVRHKDYKDANCPVPVFFLFDTVKTLEYPGVSFVEKGAAGYDTGTWKSGPEAYATLNFAKIFHHGKEGYTSDIGKYRRTEVLREGGIPLAGLLRRIICRSPAEAQTLLSLIQKRCPQQYDIYKHIIITPTVDIRSYIFNMHGIYVRAVKATTEKAVVEFNESRLRYDYNTGRKGPVPIQMKAAIFWKDKGGHIIQNVSYQGVLDYKTYNAINLNYTPFSDQYSLELYIDDFLVFQGDFYIGEQDII